MNGVQLLHGIVGNLKGLELIQVCIGYADVILHFFPDCTISVYSVSVFKDNKEFFNLISSEEDSRSPIGKQIIEAAIKNSIFTIKLSNEVVIRLVDDSKDYESLKVSVGGTTVIV